MPEHDTAEMGQSAAATGAAPDAPVEPASRGRLHGPAEPQKVDPRVLTDDRENPDLFVFEKTWGHRLLAGVGAAMLVIAAVLIVYCASQLFSVSNLAGIADFIVTVGYMLYGTGLVAGIALIPPAIVGIYVAKHPKRVVIAVALAIVALVLVALFAIAAFATAASNAATILLYTFLLAIVPVVYLVAALKIRSSNAADKPFDPGDPFSTQR